MEQTTQSYVVIVKFDKDDNLKARMMQAGPAFTDAIKELGPSQYVASAYDGSMSAFLVSCALAAEQIVARLHAPRSGAGSALAMRDCIVVLAISGGVAPNFSKITGWLSKFAAPSWAHARAR